MENLKQKLNADSEFSNEPKVDFLSTNDIICALLWRAMTRARGVTTETKLGMLVNGRKQLSKPFEFFGCASFHSYLQYSGKPVHVGLPAAVWDGWLMAKRILAFVGLEEENLKKFLKDEELKRFVQ